MSSEGYKTSKIIDSDKFLNYRPLLIISNGTTLGLSDDGRWIIKEQTGVRLLDESWKFIRLMVLLERQLTQFKQQLTDALSSSNINTVEDFPYHDIVTVGLNQKSNYWAELAVNWFVELPHANGEIIESLKQTVISEWASQKLRHRIKKILRSLEIE